MISVPRFGKLPNCTDRLYISFPHVVAFTPGINLVFGRKHKHGATGEGHIVPGLNHGYGKVDKKIMILNLAFGNLNNNLFSFPA